MDAMSDLVERLARVQGRIDAACARAGRDPGSVELLPVSKTKPAESRPSGTAAPPKTAVTARTAPVVWRPTATHRARTTGARASSPTARKSLEGLLLNPLS